MLIFPSQQAMKLVIARTV